MAVLDPEPAYYQAIEEFFVSRRGDPLFLSNADWLLIRRWRQAGLPLRVVLRGIRDALDGHDHSWGRDRKVGSLAYCAMEVDAAAERWRRALASDDASGGKTPELLRRLAERLEAAATLGDRARSVAASLARQLREREKDASLEQSESWLLAQERRLLVALERDSPPELRARIRAEVEAVLEPYRSRMPERILGQIRRESLKRRLLEAHGLPRLSLFHGELGTRDDALSPDRDRA